MPKDNVFICRCGYPLDRVVRVLKLAETQEESRTTRKLRYSCNGVLCVARQRLVSKFDVVASLASQTLCQLLKVHNYTIFEICIYIMLHPGYDYYIYTCFYSKGMTHLSVSVE